MACPVRGYTLVLPYLQRIGPDAGADDRRIGRLCRVPMAAKTGFVDARPGQYGIPGYLEFVHHQRGRGQQQAGDGRDRGYGEVLRRKIGPATIASRSGFIQTYQVFIRLRSIFGCTMTVRKSCPRFSARRGRLRSSCETTNGIMLSGRLEMWRGIG